MDLRAVGRWRCSCRRPASPTSAPCRYRDETRRGRGAAGAPAAGRARDRRRGSIARSSEALDAVEGATTVEARPAATRRRAARALLVLDRRRSARCACRARRPPAVEPAARSIAARHARAGAPRGVRARAVDAARRRLAQARARAQAAEGAEPCAEAAASTPRSPRSTTPAPRRCSGSRACSRSSAIRARPGPLDELERRFADRSFEGVPVRLVVAMLRAETAGPDALLALACRGGLGGAYVARSDRHGRRARPAAPAARRRRARACPTLAARRAALDERDGRAAQRGAVAAGLADDVARARAHRDHRVARRAPRRTSRRARWSTAAAPTAA